MAIKFKHPEHGDLEIEADTITEIGAEDQFDGFKRESELDTTYVLRAVYNRDTKKLREKSEGLVDADSLITDDEFKTSALEAWGITVDPETGKPTGEADVAVKVREGVEAGIAQQRKRWETTELAPLTGRVDKSEAQNVVLMRRDLEREILQAANDAGVKEVYRKAPPTGGLPMIVAQLAPQFGYDEESSRWSLKSRESEGYVASTKATMEAPFKNPSELLGDWKEDKNLQSEYFEDQRQPGPGLNRPGGGKGAIRLTYQESQDAGKYRAAKAEAEKLGVALEVEEYPL